MARKRALERYKKTGRYVPMDVIDDFFKVLPDKGGLTMGQYALNQLKEYVDGYIVIDGLTGQIISKGGEQMPEQRVYESQAIIEAQRALLPAVDKSAEDQGQEILDTIAGLEILAEMGDQEAIDTIEGLKLLI